ncbi:MAG: hypothetical protein ACOX2R_00015 [Anaerolineae bacterium]
MERPPRLPDLAAYVELHLALGTKGDGALDRAADAVAQRLIALVEGGQGDLGYGDVAILCRATSAFESYENALERAGVPFLTVAGKGVLPAARGALAPGDAPRQRRSPTTTWPSWARCARPCSA